MLTSLLLNLLSRKNIPFNPRLTTVLQMLQSVHGLFKIISYNTMKYAMMKNECTSMQCIFLYVKIHI